MFRWRRLLTLLIILVAALLAPPVQVAAAEMPPPMTIDADTMLPLQVEGLALLHDPSTELTLARVRSPELAQRFEPAAPCIPNLGVGSDAVWAGS